MFDETPPAAKGAEPAQAPVDPGKPKTFEEMSSVPAEKFGDLFGAEDAAKGKEPTESEEDFGEDDDEDEDGEESTEASDESDDLEDDEDDEEEVDDEEASEEESDSDDEEVFLEQKVNGKLKKFTEKEVRQIIASGAANLEFKKSVDEYKTKVVTEANQKLVQIEAINQSITPVWEQIEKGNLEEAFTLLTSQKGMNKLQAKRQLLSQVFPAICSRLGLPKEWVEKRLQVMSESNRARDLKEENDFYVQQNKELQEKGKEKPPTPEDQAMQGLSQIRMDLGIGKAELDRVLGFIEAEEGNVKITPQYIGEVTLLIRAADKAVAAIRSVRPTLVSDNRFVDKVRLKAQKNPDWPVDKIARWVDKKARQRSETQKAKELKNLQKDISGKALRGGKSGLENPKTGQKPQRFEQVDVEVFGKLA